MSSVRGQGQQLVSESQRILRRDLEGALEEGDFNLAVRRVQEAVELTLKGALKMLGVDYPKVRDGAPVFSEHLRRKVGGAACGILECIEEVSLRLAQALAAAFYMEREYSKDDARRARQDARFVVGEVKKVFESFDAGAG